LEHQELDFEEKKKKEQEEEKDKKKQKKDIVFLIILFILLILLCLFLRSCGTGEKTVAETERVYEENCTSSYGNPIPTEENKRLNLALAECYHITGASI